MGPIVIEIDPVMGVPYQPVFAYEALWDLAALAILWRLRPDGAVFATYLVLYGAGQFLKTFARQEVVWLWGLQEAQLVSAVLIAASLAWLLGRSTAIADRHQLGG